MTDEINSESTISYTVREMLDAQTSILTRIDTKLDGKADKSDLVALSGTVNKHGDRITTLEEVRRSRFQTWKAAGYIALIVGGFSSATVVFLLH